MKYGVPQKGRDYQTRRVNVLSLEAEAFSEQLMLTQIEKAFDTQTAKRLVLELKDGREVFLDFTKPLNDDTEVSTDE